MSIMTMWNLNQKKSEYFNQSNIAESIWEHNGMCECVYYMYVYMYIPSGYFT